MDFNAASFGKDFTWGAAGSAFQTEGAFDIDGKSQSIWDQFTSKAGKIKNNDHAQASSDFYHHYKEDLTLAAFMNLNAIRFSLSWPRLIPNGTGLPNRKGIDFYNRVIDTSLENNLVPWVTLYHWDLPQILEEKGGWTSRDILNWFEELVLLAVDEFGDRVNNWIVMNEPMTFTSLGYFFGLHAPGRRGFRNFLPAIHHAALCQSLGSHIIRSKLPESNVGTSFSCSVVEPLNDKERNQRAAHRVDTVINRLFIEPALGLGYPFNDFPFLKKLQKYFKPGDEERLKGDFDFIGLQYYFRIIVKHNWTYPIFAKYIHPNERGAEVNEMNLEVFPKGILTLLEKFSQYQGIRNIYITECGVCFPDFMDLNGTVCDSKRTRFFIETLESVLAGIQKGIPVKGFFAWSLTDNFEWNEGYKPRFGLVYIDYPTQQRILKDSGKWFHQFLKP